MTFDETLPMTEKALFRAIHSSLSTKNNTWRYLGIALGCGVVLYVTYKYGKHIGDKNSQAIIIRLQQQVSDLKAEVEELPDPILALSE